MQNQPQRKGSKRSLQSDLKFYYELVSQIVFSLFLLVFIGYLADKYFETESWFTMTGVLLGLISSFIAAKRTIKKWLETDQTNE